MVPFLRSSRALAAFLATATAAAVPAQQQPFCPPPIVGQPQPFPDLGPGNVLGAPVAEVGQLALAPIQDGAFHVGLSLRLAGRTDGGSRRQRRRVAQHGAGHSLGKLVDRHAAARQREALHTLFQVGGLRIARRVAGRSRRGCAGGG